MISKKIEIEVGDYVLGRISKLKAQAGVMEIHRAGKRKLKAVGMINISNILRSYMRAFCTRCRKSMQR